MKNKRLLLVYLAGFIMSVHFFSVAYINSSVLTGYLGSTNISYVYIISALLSIIILLSAPHFMRKLGSVNVFLFFTTLVILATLGISLVGLAWLTILLFIVLLSVDPSLYFCLDVNLEQEIKKEGTTGFKRSILLTVSNLALVLSPLSLVFLINQKDFSKVYLLSGLILIPLLFITLFFFKNIKNVKKPEGNPLKVLHSLTISKTQKDRDLKHVMVAHFILNFFYSWMVIYLPILLSQQIGFGWSQIGYLFVVMLLPFILFELPAGYMADHKLGEKEILIFGFIIMVISALAIPSLGTTNFWLWAIVLFASRVGASLVEISSESYFFKHVKEDDTGIISLFRIMRPLSYVIAPLIALPIFYLFSYSTSFYFLAGVTSIGLLFIPKIDTK